MARRVKLLVQKRMSLKIRIDQFANLLENDNIEQAELKLHSEHVKELFRSFEEHNDELIATDAKGNHGAEFEEIHKKYFDIMVKAERLLSGASRSDAITSRTDESARVATDHAKRRVKLPEIKLPSFDGANENWLSFKNAFRNTIDSRTELTDVDKLQYLKSALTGEAENKVKIFEVEGTNYAQAWEILMRSYDVKRDLITRHISLLVNLPSLDRETTNGLTKLADDAQQHVASLSSLGVNVTPEILVFLLESKLSKGTANRWDATLDQNQVPTPDELYEFLYKTAVTASKRDRTDATAKERAVHGPPAKKRNVSGGNRAFVLSTSSKCVACNRATHPLYKCDNFNRLTVPQRIEIVKSAKLCFNCMRQHRARNCRFAGCTICHKRHNTLLHLEQLTKPNSDTNVANKKEKEPPA